MPAGLSCIINDAWAMLKKPKAKPDGSVQKRENSFRNGKEIRRSMLVPKTVDHNNNYSDVKDVKGNRNSQFIEEWSVVDKLADDTGASTKFIRSKSLQKDAAKRFRPRFWRRLNAKDILSNNYDKLTELEIEELSKCPEVYYLGHILERTLSDRLSTKISDLQENKRRSYYNSAPHEHIAYRYEILKSLGHGTFGEVFKVYDHKDFNCKALKIIRNDPKFEKSAVMEVKVLESLRKEGRSGVRYAVQMYDNFSFRGHVCITFELLSVNLYELQKRSPFGKFSTALIRKFAFAILRCLSVLSRLHVIHCDLKPENVLLKNSDSCDIKVIDFGSSCFEGQEMYMYIQSRYYRAPEVLLGARYGRAIDMWSLGCILSEMYIGQPIFQGDDEFDQLASIVEVLDLPPQNLLQTGRRRKLFVPSSGSAKSSSSNQRRRSILAGSVSKTGKLRGLPGSKSLTNVFQRCQDKKFVDFVRKCLTLDPTNRISVEEAVRHPWFSS